MSTKSILMTKKQLSQRITETLKRKKVILTKSQVEAIINEFLEQVKQALIRREELRFPGYLSLKTTLQKPRVAMNLQTKKKMTIPAKRVPKVKFSEDLKKLIAKKK